MNLDIGRLTPDDVGDAWQLSTQVGWNQTEADWWRLLELFPETCFAGRIEGALVATSTLATYGHVGWIGMVLVDEEYRRRGYGSELFERALDTGVGVDLEIVGLDATDAGRTVYSQYGFENVGGIDRWIGTIETVPELDNTERVRNIRAVGEIAPFDRRHTGVDRRALLEHLLATEGVSGLCCERDGKIRGYGIVRPGRIHPQIGPVVASEREHVETLFVALMRRLDEPIVVDAPRNARTEAILKNVGLDIQRRLYRMTHDEPRSVLDGEGIVAATGFEWG